MSALMVTLVIFKVTALPTGRSSKRHGFDKKSSLVYYFSESKFIIHTPALEGFK